MSWINPFFTSLPVATMAAVFRTQGRSSSRGVSPAAALAAVSFSSAMIRGITRIPASLAPFLTAVPPFRVAIISSSMAFTARRDSDRTRNSPSQDAFSSILPSLTPLRSIFSLAHRASRRSAPSSSWSIPGVISHTYRCSLPMPSSTGMSSGATTWPLRNRASLYWSLMIWVRSWHSTWPTASSVRISFMLPPPESRSHRRDGPRPPGPPRRRYPPWA